MSMHKIVNYIAGIQYRKNTRVLDIEDIRAECYLLYVEAELKWDSSKHTTRGKYIFGYVFGRVNRYVNKQLKESRRFEEYDDHSSETMNLSSGNENVDMILKLIESGAIGNSERNRFGWNTIAKYLRSTLNYTTKQIDAVRCDCELYYAM